MHPVLLRLGGFTIYSYGVMLMIAFIVGIYLVEHRAKRIGVRPEKVWDLAIWVLFAVVIGSRLLYVILHWDEFSSNPIEIVAFWRGGLAGLMFYGGFLLALAVGVWWVQKNRLPLLKLLDAVAPAVALGETITRIGCFLNGCCFGQPTNLPWGVVFPPHSAAGNEYRVPIHPTQLYSSLAGLAIFLLIVFVMERRGWRPGTTFFGFLFLYSLARFLVDFIRWYEDLANHLVNRMIAGGLIVGALIGLYWIQRRRGAPIKAKG